MPIISSDIQLPLSGGASNTVQNAALGGAASTTTEANSTLFDNVDSTEASTGDTEYRCFYIKNNHATLTAIDLKLWITANTPSANTEIAIGLGTSAIGANEQTVANENTAPAGVTFSLAATEGAALTVGDLTPGQTKAIWVRRVVNAGTAAASDSTNIRFKCDTLP